MPARLTLGILAALRAVLIPGEAALLMDRPLRWPRPFRSATVPHLRIVADHEGAEPAIAAAHAA